VQIRISQRDGVPFYLQIVNQVKYLVASGRLRCEDRLPPVRKLAEQLIVNPNTVARCYTELEREGVLNTRQGLGVFVAKPKAELTTTARRQKLTETLDRFLTEAVHLGFSAEEVLAAVSERAERFQWNQSASRA